MPPAGRNLRQSVEDLILPILRQRGYRGCWPAMRRHTGGRVDVIAFELASHGRRLRVALSTAAAAGPTGGSSTDATAGSEPVSLLTPTGSAATAGGWFSLEPGASGRGSADAVAASVLDAFIEHGGPWWDKAPPPPPPTARS